MLTEDPPILILMKLSHGVGVIAVNIESSSFWKTVSIVKYKAFKMTDPTSVSALLCSVSHQGRKEENEITFFL